MTIAIKGFWWRMLMAVAPEYAKQKELQRRFNEIVGVHDNLIMRLCFGYARTAAELDDLHQDVLVNIWQGLPRFRGDSSLKTWIYRVTLNTCVSTLRSRSRQPEAIPLESLIDFSDTSEESIEMVKDIHNAISELSPTDKAVILLWLDGMSYDEIASLTGLNRNAVGTRIHRAKDKLKKIL